MAAGVACLYNGAMAASQDKPLRIGWVVGPHTFTHWGAVLDPLARALSDQGVEIHWFSPYVEDAPERDYRWEPPSEPSLLRRWLWNYRAVDVLADRVRQSKVELLHALDSSAMRASAHFSHHLDLPYVVTWCRRGRSYLPSARLPLPRAVLACCETIQNNLLERKLIAEDQVELIRPGFVPAEGPRRLAREDRRIAILADRMDNGIEPMASALHAGQALADREMACALFLMGMGRDENRLRREARKLPIGRDVTFVGRQPETHYLEIIASADLYLQVGSSDDLPLHTLLAMASGVATIAPAGQVGEFLDDGRTTMLFDEGSPGQVSTKLQTALTDRSGTDDRTAAALEYVRDKYSLAEMARRTLAVYHRCRQGR